MRLCNNTKRFINILLIIITLNIFLSCADKTYDTDIFDAVPATGEFVFKFSSLENLHNKLNESDEIIKDICQFGTVRDFKKAIDSIIRTTENDDKLSDIDWDKDFVVVTKLTGKSDLEYLYILKYGDSRQEKTLLTLVKGIFKDYKTSDREYNGEKIHTFRKDKEEYNISLAEGLMLISKSPLFTEDAIRQMNTSPKLKETKNFQAVYKTINEDIDINIFINNNSTQRLFKSIISSEYSYLCTDLYSLAEHTALDIEIEDNYVQLAGFSKTSDNSYQMFDVFREQEPTESEIIDIIPSGVAEFALISLSDTEKYRDNYKKYLNSNDKLRSYKISMNNATKLYGTDFEKDFYSFFDGEALMTALSVNSLNTGKDKLAVIKTKSGSLTKSTMLNMLRYRAKQQNKDINNYIQNINIDRQKSFDIYRLEVYNLPYKLFGTMFKDVYSKYFAIVDNYLLMGGSTDVLKRFLHSYTLKESIKNDVFYKESAKLFASKDNFKFYANSSSSLPLIANCFNDDIKNSINRNKDNISKFYSLCYQFSSLNNMIFNNLFFMYSETLKERPRTIWESGLDAKVRMKPVIVMNHYTDEKEIFIQDENNNIYLMNSLGRVLWKLPIDGKINSEVYQVDKYRNKKLQYLFSTKDKIFLIDRNGNYVDRFPIRLKSETDKGISVFDYDSSRDYRIFVPCKDRKVYLYDTDGNTVKGWNFGKAENNILTKVQHYRIGTKDYIVFADEFKIYILNRRGEIRSRTKKYFDVAKNAEFMIFNERYPDRAYMMLTDTKGHIYKISFSGKVEKQAEFKDFAAGHYFAAEDLNANGRPEYIFAQGSELSVYNDKGKLFDINIDGNIADAPIIFSFGLKDKRIGIVDSANQLIYLIDNKGDIYKGFPVRGISPFSISFMRGENKGFNLFTGGSGNSLFNYKVQ